MSPEENALDLSNHAEEVAQLIERGDLDTLTALVEDLHPVELSTLLELLEPEFQPPVLQCITGLDRLAEIVSFASDNIRQQIVETVDDSRIAAILRRLEIDEAADIVGYLPRRRQASVLRRLRTDRSREILSLVAYDKETAGGIMTTLYLSLPVEITAEEAVTTIRQQLSNESLDPDTEIRYVYLLEESRKLAGVCSLREVLAAPGGTKLRSMMKTDIVVVGPEDDQEKVAQVTKDYALSAIPVVAPENGQLLGIVTVDDVLSVIEEENTEDILKLAGTEDSDYIGASLPMAYRSRLPWLLASWLGGVSGAILLGSFESTLEKYVSLAFFMPVVFGMGGNVGSQSSTITVRGLATGALGDRKASKRVRREAFVGFALGITFAMLLAVAALILFGDRHLAMVVSVSIMITMTASSALGSSLPMLFKRLNLDPAVSSGPLVTTMTDIMSIMIYFSVASILM